MAQHRALVAAGVFLALTSPCTCGLGALPGAALSIAALVLAARYRTSLLPAIGAVLLNLFALACVLVGAAALARGVYRQAVDAPGRIRELANHFSVAGFGNNFAPESIVASASDQGPWGGWRTVHWRSDTEVAFQRESLVDYARDNGWELVGQRALSAQELKGWRAFGVPVVPLGHRGLGATGQRFTDSTCTRFDRRIESDSTLLAFTTGIVAIAPGTDDVCEVNGYLSLSADGRAFSVYHLWGE